MDNIVIEEKRSKANRLAAAGFGMFLISAALLVYGILYRQIIYLVIGIVATIFFGISFLISLTRALRSRPLLTITLDGIIDSSCTSAAGFISFLDIDRFESVNVFGQKAIGVVPKDTKEFLHKLKHTQRKNAEMNMKMNYPPVLIRVDTAKDMSIEDILSMLKKRLVDYSRLYD